MSKLPSKLLKRHCRFPNACEAYAIVRSLETILSLSARSLKVPSTFAHLKRALAMKRNLVYIRLLGYLIIHLPPSHWDLQLSGKGTSITTEILKRKDQDEKLLELGKWYYTLYLQFFHYKKRPVSSVYPEAVEFGREFYETIDELTAQLLRGSEHASGLQTHRFAKRRSLVRDSFRCLLTGKYDMPCVRVCAEFQEKLLTPGVIPDCLSIAGCAHIIPPRVRREVEGYDERFTWDDDVSRYIEELPDASLLSDLEMVFGYPGLLEELNGQNINRLENVLTLKDDLHDCFMIGDLWLVPDDPAGGYKVKSGLPLAHPYSIALRHSPNPEFPQPSSKFLHIHGIIAEVAHLSGASAYRSLMTCMRDHSPNWDSPGDDSKLDDLFNSSWGRESLHRYLVESD